MPKSVKFTSDIYLDSIGIVHNKKKLNTLLHDYIIVGNVDVKNVNVSAVANASVPTGYKFLCWLQPASYGTIKGAYMEIYNSSSTLLFVINADSSNHSFHCPYLCIRDI